jgi:16S rRNA (guanine527-N7)-methyltransferase
MKELLNKIDFGDVYRSSATYDVIMRFHAELAKWNPVHRLVGSVDSKQFVDRHFFDAVQLAKVVSGGDRLVDLGAGAGLPTILFKILCPGIDCVLVEPRKKRVAFCRHVIREIDLLGITVIEGRAEDQEVIGEVGEVSVVVSRATWNFEELRKYSEPYVGSGGRIIALRGIEDREGLQGQVEVIPYVLPFSGKERCLVISRFT